ncbi:matrixin family metalloprotease [Myxococcota bacterium]
MRGLAAGMILTLVSGLVQAQIDNSALECLDTGNTFFPRGDHWPADFDGNNNIIPVLYRQQVDGAPGISDGSDLEAVRTALATWMNFKCPDTDEWPDILINDYHDHGQDHYANRDRGDEYECNDGGVCGQDCDKEECNLISVQNIIYFITSDWTEKTLADSHTVALTTNLFVIDTGFIVTADLEFNAEHFQWRTPASGCTEGADNCYDVESVALHEAGHVVGLNHVMCADAVMFPHGSGTEERLALTPHEIDALCSIYPPRDAGLTDPQQRDTGEQCSSTSQCPSGHACIKPYRHDASSPWGWCGQTCDCTSGCADDCPRAFLCVTSDNGQKFCKPGPNGTGGAVVGGTDPTTGESLDICAPCTKGAQCASGICIGDADNGICTLGCVPGALEGEGGEGAACPSGMECVLTDQNFGVCWPVGPDTCGSPEFRGMLNELCYLEGTPGDTGDDWFRSCGPDLICFGFKPRCAGQEGACVQYCATGTPCNDGNMECCYGVDAAGSCVGSESGLQHGGCFDIRGAGETCVNAEQSICTSGTGCFHFGNPLLSKCYTQCAATCEFGATCVVFQDECTNSFGLCCESDDWEGSQVCLPVEDPTLYDVGVMCRTNDDCDSDLCLKYEGESACSRWCNPFTGVGCPGDIDVNGDGATDGGFRCRLISGEGRCWPLRGPAEPPEGFDDVEPPGGCCSAVAARPGDWLLTALLFLPLLLLRPRRSP